MIYYPIQKNWSRRIEPHLTNKRVQATLVRDFNKYTYGRWRQRFLPGMRPTEFESCDWRVTRGGRQPEYFDFVKHGACHWLVGFNLRNWLSPSVSGASSPAMRCLRSHPAPAPE